MTSAHERPSAGTGFFEHPPGPAGWVHLQTIALELDRFPRPTPDAPEVLPPPFSVVESFAYFDAHHDEPFVVPIPDRSLRSDLTSVPQFLTWLVPREGPHLPAALVHDALVVDVDDRPDPVGRLPFFGVGAALGFGLAAMWLVIIQQHTIAAAAAFALFCVVGGGALPDASGDGVWAAEHDGPRVSRVEADRIFRDAMADDVGPVRRWLIWTAVSAATVWASPGSDRWRAWRWRAVVLVTFAGTILLGLVATLDLFDVAPESGFTQLPWMGDRSTEAELRNGLGGAVAIPAVGAVAWRRSWPTFLIGGVMLALLLHVTIAVAATYVFVYLGPESLLSRFDRRRRRSR